MSKFVSFFKLCVAFLAGIGGFGYAMYCKAYKAAFKDCDN